MRFVGEKNYSESRRFGDPVAEYVQNWIRINYGEDLAKRYLDRLEGLRAEDGLRTEDGSEEFIAQLNKVIYPYLAALWEIGRIEKSERESVLKLIEAWRQMSETVYGELMTEEQYRSLLKFWQNKE